MATLPDGVDLAEIPDYQEVPEGLPLWRKNMLEAKNKKAIETYLQKKQDEEMEASKWKDVPVWKRDLIVKKQERARVDNAATEEERRRAQDEAAKLEAMPQWKRDLVLKKRQEEKQNNS